MVTTVVQIKNIIGTGKICDILNDVIFFYFKMHLFFL